MSADATGDRPGRAEMIAARMRLANGDLRVGIPRGRPRCIGTWLVVREAHGGAVEAKTLADAAREVLSG